VEREEAEMDADFPCATRAFVSCSNHRLYVYGVFLEALSLPCYGCWGRCSGKMFLHATCREQVRQLNSLLWFSYLYPEMRKYIQKTLTLTPPSPSRHEDRQTKHMAYWRLTRFTKVGSVLLLLHPKLRIK